jgi:bacteriorhodopsin
MEEDNQNPRRYKWPWFALAAVLLGIVLAVVWVSFAVKKVERERNFRAPVSAGAK